MRTLTCVFSCPCFPWPSRTYWLVSSLKTAVREVHISLIHRSSCQVLFSRTKPHYCDPVVSVPTRHTPICQPPAVPPNCERTKICGNPNLCRGQRHPVTQQRMDARHSERNLGTGRTLAQDGLHSGRLCCPLGHAPAKVRFCKRE